MKRRGIARICVAGLVIIVGLMGVYRVATAVATSFPSVDRVLTQAVEDWPDHEVRMDVVTFPPGSKSPDHRHPGAVFVYVLEGEVDTRVGDGEVTRYKAGDTFYEPAEALHADTRNPSKTETARILAVMLTEEGKASLKLAH